MIEYFEIWFFNVSNCKTICSTVNHGECVANIKVDFNDCQIPCEGIYMDFNKHEPDNIVDEYHETLLESYHKYKRFFDVNDSNHS